MLKKSHIPMVKHVVVDRTSSAPLDFKEFPNHIEVNGVVLEKPFVEKPVQSFLLPIPISRSMVKITTSTSTTTKIPVVALFVYFVK